MCFSHPFCCQVPLLPESQTSWEFVKRTGPLRPLQTTSLRHSASCAARAVIKPPMNSTRWARLPKHFPACHGTRHRSGPETGTWGRLFLRKHKMHESKRIKHPHIIECSCCLVTSCFKLINSKELAPCAKECVRGKIDAQPFFLSLGPWQHESQCFHDSSDSSTFLAWKLVGGVNHCEKYEFVNWDDYPQYMGKTCSKPPTS